MSAPPSTSRSSETGFSSLFINKANLLSGLRVALLFVATLALCFSTVSFLVQPLHAADSNLTNSQKARGLDYEQSMKEGKDQMTSSEFTRARESFRTALSLRPSSEEAHYWAGKAASALGDLEEAVFHWQQVMQIRASREKNLQVDPQRSMDELAKLSIKDAASRIQEASRRFATGLKNLEAGQWDRALAQFRRARELDPSRSEFYEREGDVLMDKELFELAAEAYASSEARGGTNPDLFIKLGESYCRLGRYREEAEAYRRGLSHGTSQTLRARLKSASEKLLKGYDAFAQIVKRDGREVIINKGSATGIPRGQEYALRLQVVARQMPVADVNSSEVIAAPYTSVKGELLVTRVEERISYCMITREGRDDIGVGDPVQPAR